MPGNILLRDSYIERVCNFRREDIASLRRKSYNIPERAFWNVEPCGG